MSLQCEPTAVPEVRVLTPRVYRDPRGFFMETFHEEKYRAAGVARRFVQDNYSHSGRGTLRGLHYQLRRPQAKLVSVIWGTIFDVAVDIRAGSPTFGRWVGQTLSDENRCQLFIPEGFAHGFCVLSERADVMYKCTDFYHPQDDRGVLWNDPAIGIQWPLTDPLLSDKDRKLKPLAEIPPEDLPAYRAEGPAGCAASL
jgi:dTDP-4-dehydrorhamnose 3,5-epimerase